MLNFIIGLIIGVLGIIATWFFYTRSLYYGKASENKIVGVVEKKISELRDELESVKPILSELAENKNTPNLKRDAISSLKNIEDIENKIRPFSDINRIVLVNKMYADAYKRDLESLKRFSHLSKEEFDKLKKIFDETRNKVFMKVFPNSLKHLIVGLKIPENPAAKNT